MLYISVACFTGVRKLAGLAVGNVFYLCQVQVDVEPMSVFRDSVVINEPGSGR